MCVEKFAFDKKNKKLIVYAKKRKCGKCKEKLTTIRSVIIAIIKQSMVSETKKKKFKMQGKY